MSHPHRRRSERGFTLVEMMMSVMLIGILAAMAVLQVASVRPGMLADGAMRSVMGQLNYARELALSSRRDIQVVADIGANRLQLVRLPIPPAVETTVVSEITFEGGVTFGILGGAADTPDSFGNASAADFDTNPIRFTTDGTLVGNAGSPANGTLFLVIPGVGGSFRAVTILGSTGRVRGYRWTGTQWTRV